MYYRYQSLNSYSLSNIENDDFYISSADTFNDYFDIQFAYDTKRLYELYKNNKALLQEFEKFRMKYDYKIKSSKEIFIEYIQYVCNCFLVNIKRKCFICCLSKNNNNAVMWSHYANNNTGYVLGYDEKDLELLLKDKINTRLLRVKYESKPYDTTNLIIESLNNGIVGNKFNMRESYLYFENLVLSGKCDMHSFLRKSEEWAYEKEYRFILFFGDSKGNEHKIIGKLKPKEIIIGQKMDLNTKLNLFYICNSKNITLYKADISYDIANFNIMIEQFTTDDLKDINILISEIAKNDVY